MLFLRTSISERKPAGFRLHIKSMLHCEDGATILPGWAQHPCRMEHRHQFTLPAHPASAHAQAHPMDRCIEQSKNFENISFDISEAQTVCRSAYAVCQLDNAGFELKACILRKWPTSRHRDRSLRHEPMCNGYLGKLDPGAAARSSAVCSKRQ